MLVLDTDHMSLLEWGGEGSAALRRAAGGRRDGRTRDDHHQLRRTNARVDAYIAGREVCGPGGGRLPTPATAS